MNVILPKRIGSVRVLERLGEGGMAFVHRAEDLYRPELLLAVKFLRAEVSTDSELVKRFFREGEVLKRLKHPHLVEVYDFGRAGSVPFILMELLPGGAFKQCRGEPPARIVTRLVPVIEALVLAHTAGVVHRDLKPSNLLFAADGRLKVTDFGVCLWEGGEGTRSTKSQMVVGTLGYMSPEQHGDPRKVDGRCDVYALGAILYEYTTGQPYSQVQLPPAASRPGFPPRLAGILVHALAPDPAKRTPSMDVFANELKAWLESAEAVGWGEEPLPGFSTESLERATKSCVKGRRGGQALQGPHAKIKGGPLRSKGTEGPLQGRDDSQEPLTRLGPYLDALRSGGVGVRRAAAEGLVRSARMGDEAYLLAVLEEAPEGARFALASVLAFVGGPDSLPKLLGLLEDPFARAEAAEAASRIALRHGCEASVLERLREAGLGSPWRWAPRARLGDSTWVEALQEAWPSLPLPQRLQTLVAALELPEDLRRRVKDFTRASAERGGSLREAWDAL